jgi:hypothetical protein
VTHSANRIAICTLVAMVYSDRAAHGWVGARVEDGPASSSMYTAGGSQTLSRWRLPSRSRSASGYPPTRRDVRMGLGELAVRERGTVPRPAPAPPPDPGLLAWANLCRRRIAATMGTVSFAPVLLVTMVRGFHFAWWFLGPAAIFSLTQMWCACFKCPRCGNAVQVPWFGGKGHQYASRCGSCGLVVGMSRATYNDDTARLES